MAQTANQILGACGERHALAHYERLGFALVERNWRTRGGEIDLIVADARTLIFVEVKARRSGGLDPLLSFKQSKRRRLRRALTSTKISVRASATIRSISPPRVRQLRSTSANPSRS